MCVIIAKPDTAELSEERARRLWSINSDGGGFSYIDNGNRIRIHKSMEFSEFWHKYSSMQGRFPDKFFLLHMRIATHGSVNVDNVHPFRVDEHTVMAHNGVIRCAVSYLEAPIEVAYKGVDQKGKAFTRTAKKDPKDRSDTRIFVEEWLPQLPENWLDNPWLVTMVEEFIGASKLVFLTNNPALDKNVYFLNKSSGTTQDGMWFSNTHGVHETRLPTYTTTTTAYKSPYPQPRSKLPMSAVTATLLQLPPNIKPFPAGSKEQENSLDRARENKNFNDDILFIDDHWVCMDCATSVIDITGPEYGECSCYDLFCLNCGALPMDCNCPPRTQNFAMFDDPKWGTQWKQDQLVVPEAEAWNDCLEISKYTQKRR